MRAVDPVVRRCDRRVCSGGAAGRCTTGCPPGGDARGRRPPRAPGRAPRRSSGSRMTATAWSRRRPAARRCEAASRASRGDIVGNHVRTGRERLPSRGRAPAEERDAVRGRTAGRWTCSSRRPRRHVRSPPPRRPRHPPGTPRPPGPACCRRQPASRCRFIHELRGICLTRRLHPSAAARGRPRERRRGRSRGGGSDGWRTAAR